MLKWGLIPSWVRTEADADEIRYKTFNARAESIDTKPSFSSSFHSMRCLIPVRGFYEWQHTASKKIPWYIHQPDDSIISLAGLYSEWSQGGSGKLLLTFSIITTEANELMAVVHNSGKRMPVILDREDEKKWIDLSTPPSEAQSLLKPCPSDHLKAYTISPLINSKTANRNTPEVIRPFDYHSRDLLF